jgi:hypothetical protein
MYVKAAKSLFPEFRFFVSVSSFVCHDKVMGFSGCTTEEMNVFAFESKKTVKSALVKKLLNVC